MRFDATPEIDLLPAKRARLTRTGTQRLEIENEKLEQADKTTLQLPKSNPPYASFLKDSVDPVDPNSRPESVYTFVSDMHTEPPDYIETAIDRIINAEVSKERRSELRVIADGLRDGCLKNVRAQAGEDDFIDPLHTALKGFGS